MRIRQQRLHRSYAVGLLLAFVTMAPAAAETFKTQAGTVELVTVASGLEHPWGLVFLPDGLWGIVTRQVQRRCWSTWRKHRISQLSLLM